MKHANELLQQGEDALPDNVIDIVTFCVENDIGYVLSRNQYAGTCRDARSKRYRLGHVGIPLYDELKSIVGITVDSAGNSIVLAMHCRGHMEIDYHAVQELLGHDNEISVLSENNLKEWYNLEFGIVNPFLLDIKSMGEIVQIFDVGVMTPISTYPGTMMTNAGGHYWGIEFDVRKIVLGIKGSKVAPIAKQDKELLPWDLPQCTNPKSIGIITGNGPESGMALWRSINKNIASMLGDHFLGDMSLPEVHVVSLPAMGLSMELDKRESATWSVLHRAVETLKMQNVDLLTLACHTTHFFEDRIRDSFDSSQRVLISMPQTVAEYLHKEDIKDVAILGIPFVADLGEWSAYSFLNEKKITIEKLEPIIMKRFHDIGYNVKQMGDNHKSFQQLISLIKNDIKSSNVIIALTELSILLENSGKKTRQSEKNIIDALDLYSWKIARASLGMD